MNVTGPTTVSQVLPAGTKLHGGDFSVGKVLGQGGFGITYLGSETRLRRSVAIKEFFPQGCVRQSNTVQPSGAVTPVAFQSCRKEFLEEARVVAGFRHPGIVKIHTFFEENNTAYMVMEFLKGKTLVEHVEKRGALAENEVIGYVEKIGEALDVVHRAGRIHRDIKPENIILTDDRRAVLIDFGSAREFAKGKTSRMTAMVTHGYAPLEQYGEHAKFGVFTDIYALGATTYHLLTGQIPYTAPDRASGVSLPPPIKVNTGISPVVNDAVMWAMEIKVDKRPQSVGEFLQALSGAKTRPTTGGQRKGGSSTQEAPPVSTNVNPHESQIQRVVEELNKPASPPPPSKHDARIGEIKTRITTIPSSVSSQTNLCPACRNADLVKITGEPTGRCPLCRTAYLQKRQLEESRCPVCRSGGLQERTVPAYLIFCPVCRVVPLQAERRKKMGMPVDLWWVCPHCKAELDVITGGKAKLVTVPNDPFGVGVKHQGQTLAIAEWKAMSARSGTYLECNQCTAQLDVAEGGRASLIRVASDPYGIGKAYLSKTLFRHAWAKIASGLPLTAGNLFCPQCKAELNHQSSDSTLNLLQFNETTYAWAKPWQGKPVPISHWYSAISGKRSLHPGLLCPNCKTEFDNAQARFLLHSTNSSALTPHVKQVYSLEDWHRLVAGVPTSIEEKQLRDELSRLEDMRQKEHKQFRESQKQQRAQAETRLTELLRQSFLAGFVPLPTTNVGVALKQGETVHWHSQAEKLKVRSVQGQQYWDTDGIGSLVVTNQRIYFHAPQESLWQKPLGKVATAEIQRVSSKPILVLQIDGLQKPIGFDAAGLQITVPVDGQTRALSLTVQDLVRLLKSLR